MSAFVYPVPAGEPVFEGYTVSVTADGGEYTLTITK